MKRDGFSLIELVIVVAILGIMFSMIRIPWGSLFTKNNKTMIASRINERIYTAYVKAASGTFLEENGEAVPAGVFFEENKITSFVGDIYLLGAVENEEYILPSGWRVVNVEFLDSRLLFAVGGGEVSDWSTGNNGFSILRVSTGEVFSYEVNNWGVLSEV